MPHPLSFDKINSALSLFFGGNLIRTATNEQLARIDEILRQLDQAPAERPQGNRRRIARINIHITLIARVLSHGGHLTLKVFTRNISTSGIGFVSRRFCRPGERIALSFTLPDRPSKLVLATITFSRYVRAGLYETGAEFVECVDGRDDGDIPVNWSRPLETQNPAAVAKKEAKSKKEKPSPDADVPAAPGPSAAATPAPAVSEKSKTAPAP